ncbi:hypothetical protein An07g06790 [Aspergillus niger]|uniref:Uncharacterized protein n=2 Tax=Aspergillus niger TaxID=5061 RepID=A2QNS2_ASPNC|nr:hypothetical protein An07g06790 [Aspergillus niger]CAK39524.1 hypothetical protein An07g06790 [Aspergillus niger]
MIPDGLIHHDRAKGLGRASSLVCIEHVQVERDGSSAVEATVVCQRTLENCQLAKAKWLCNTSQHSARYITYGTFWLQAIVPSFELSRYAAESDRGVPFEATKRIRAHAIETFKIEIRPRIHVNAEF